jgi:hypothetical protein
MIGRRNLRRQMTEAPFCRLWFVCPSSDGAIAQLGERVLCKHEVVGSIPSGSTIRVMDLKKGGSDSARDRFFDILIRCKFDPFRREALFCRRAPVAQGRGP